MTGWGAARAAAIAVLAGVVGAVAWWVIAPRPRVEVRVDGVFFRDPDPEQFAAADAWFGVVAFVLGVVVGVLVWRLARRAPLGAVIGLAAGGLVGALVMRALGQWLGRADLQAIGRRPVGTLAWAPLRLQASAMLLVLPVTALAAWLVCDLVSDYREARSARGRPDGPPDEGAGEQGLGDGAAADDVAVDRVSPDVPPAPPAPPSA